MTNSQADKPSVQWLLPCPFCGSNNASPYSVKSNHSVLCVACGGEGPEQESDDEAIAAWNRRQSAAEELPPIAPVAWHCEWAEWSQYHDASDPLPQTWEGAAPLKITPLYAAPPSALLLEVLEALKRSNEWLATYPAGGTMSVTGPYEQSRAAIAKLREWMGEKG